MSNWVYPLAIVTDSGRAIISAVPLENLFSLKNQGLYADQEFPTLSKEQLSNLTGTQLDFFQNWLAVNRHQWEIPDDRFINEQRGQNPSTIVFTTEARPLSIRYPKTFGKPNTSFEITLPYLKNNEGEVIDVDINGLITGRAQLQYPFNHAASAPENGPFSNTVNLLIETPRMELSYKVLEKLSQDSALKAWQGSRNGKIILTEVKGGVTQEMIVVSLQLN